MSSEADEKELELRMASFRHDPLGHVLYSYPWGEGELKNHQGPSGWEGDFLDEIGRDLRAGRSKDDEGLWIYTGKAIQKAVAAGHDVGKSAVVAWLVLWAISTFVDTRGVVTANTDTQLSTKTWPEVTKWHRLFIASHWFVCPATSIYAADAEHEKNWRIDAIPWNRAKTESFAGLHNLGKRVLFIFDESSAIDDPIWEVTEGATLDKNTEIIWAVFGNPTRNSGRLHACFHSQRQFWSPRHVDARNSPFANQDKIAEWKERYGEDSDFFRVRVRGVFPRVGDRQFISSAAIHEARGRQVAPTAYAFAPKILTLDNAWDGGDEIVIGLRQGIVYRQLAAFAKNDDDRYIATRLARLEDEEKADAVFIDKGYGTGVYSLGKGMRREWVLIAFGEAASDPHQFLNKRAEMWSMTRDWLRAGGCIPDDEQLCIELGAPELIGREDAKIQLEAKKDIKKRLGFSPGRADALALTFAMPVRKKDAPMLTVPRYGREMAHNGDYDPMDGA